MSSAVRDTSNILAIFGIHAEGLHERSKPGLQWRSLEQAYGTEVGAESRHESAMVEEASPEATTPRGL